MPLSVTQQSALANASSVGVRAAALRVRSHTPEWLDAGNIYRSNCVGVYKPGVVAPDDSALLEYLAASVPTHTADGWSFIGRAVDCHVRGDAHGALHLAYYAELRAAIAILAYHGIGVLNNVHPIYDHTPAHTPITGLGTHAFAWLALEHWSTQAAAAKTVGTLISAHGYSLEDWMTAAGFTITGAAIVGDWLKSWGVDLSKLSEDRGLRNEVSYRPTDFNRTSRSGTSAATEFLQHIWTPFQPGTAPSIFESIDQYLIRHALTIAFDAIVAPGDPSYRTRLEALMRTAVTQLSFAPERGNEIHRFLTDTVLYPDPWIITEAQKRPIIAAPAQYPQVISRALLLLRVSTGITNLIATDGAWTESDLRSWITNIGVGGGLWDEGAAPGTTSDLWLDVEIALSDIASWQAPPAPALHKRKWHMENAPALLTLSGMERVGLWALNL